MRKQGCPRMIFEQNIKCGFLFGFCHFVLKSFKKVFVPVSAVSLAEYLCCQLKVLLEIGKLYSEIREVYQFSQNAIAVFRRCFENKPHSFLTARLSSTSESLTSFGGETAFEDVSEENHVQHCYSD